MKEKIRNYQLVATLGKSAPELIVKVYDGAIGNLEQASEYYGREDFQRGYEKMETARKFIVHLYTTLDLEKGGEIAAKLSQLYAFIVEKIDIVQATKDISAIRNSIEILSNIREGWVQLAKNLKNKTESAEETAAPERQVGSISISI